MPLISSSTGLTITNPLVLYHALLATKRIDPDPAQHRLALHLQKLYYRLKDYEPEIEYSRRLEQISRTLSSKTKLSSSSENDGELNGFNAGTRNGVFSAFRTQKEKASALALTKQLTSQESAVHLQSPRGLLLYGEVGTGKSMLVDLLADCLPNRKKRRWHFNTFMLETFARLEHLRRDRMRKPAPNNPGQGEEHSLLWLARDMISTSPILFLDEFQLPDRAASKILSNLLTSFFHLGGVLVATSNRMPEELANASGIEFAPPPSSRLGLLGNRWGLLGTGSNKGRSESMFSGKGDFTAFLEVLRARCEVWDIEGGKDWRRREADGDNDASTLSDLQGSEELQESNDTMKNSYHGLEPMVPGNWGLGYEQSSHVKTAEPTCTMDTQRTESVLPKKFYTTPSQLSTAQATGEANRVWEAAVLKAVSSISHCPNFQQIPWQTSHLSVYGRNVFVPRHLSGVTMWSFHDLCASNLGPADYISLASNFHTVILVGVPILTLLHKNEARRLITLLDALYEARCKLLIRAEAGPDNIFFPETANHASDNSHERAHSDGTYAETFSEIYQDQTLPFRPNISSYTPSSSYPSYAASPLPATPYTQPSFDPSPRSILADEDSDFGPVYGAGRSPSSHFPSSEPTSGYRNTRGPGDGAPGAGNEIGGGPNFQRTGIFTGEDERFAYKRARSRLWEMCGNRWWAREEEGWWRPVGRAVRRWEGISEVSEEQSSLGGTEAADAMVDPSSPKPTGDNEIRFKHGASPFRTSEEPPPKIPWVHAWGMMTWGKKAGAWGKGVDGLSERKKNQPGDPKT